MFGMTVLFVIMTFGALAEGRHIATQPFNLHAILPTFNFKYFATIGMLIYAMNGGRTGCPVCNPHEKAEVRLS